MTTTGRTIRLFLVDGTATGLMTAEIMNWTGHVLVVPRTMLADAQRREEALRTGVYILTGPDPEHDGRTAAYIGESDSVLKRLGQHAKDDTKDWWSRAIIITSKDQNLTKAHGRYLEARLIEIAQAAKRMRLINGNAASKVSLPESDIADCEYFLSQIQQVLPVLGLELLKRTPQHTFAAASPAPTMVDAEPVSSPTLPSVRFDIVLPKRNIRAEALLEQGEIIVLAGSEASAEWVGEKSHTYAQLHAELVHNGVLSNEVINGKRHFTEDRAFSSPSAAAAICFGRQQNGRQALKVAGTNQTYAAWETEQMIAAPKPSWLAVSDIESEGVR